MSAPFKLKEYIDDAAHLRDLLKTKACVTVGQSIGKGGCATVFDIGIDDTPLSTAHLALKIETEFSTSDETESRIQKEINITSACSSLVALKKCINFVMLYGTVKIPNEIFNNATAHTTLTFETEEARRGDKYKNKDVEGAVTYGSIMGKIETTSADKRIMTPEIFWQITMALCALRTQYGKFHNDAHTGNVFLTRVSEPCDIVYNRGLRQRIVHLAENDYYAVLGDFGWTSGYPAALISTQVLSDVFTGNKKPTSLNYVSDMQRLITCSGITIEPAFLGELKAVWDRLRAIIGSTIVGLATKGNITLVPVRVGDNEYPFPKSITSDGVRIFTSGELLIIGANLKRQFLDRSSEFFKCYSTEYSIVMKYAFKREHAPALPPNSIVCDMSEPTKITHIDVVTSCAAENPSNPCIRDSVFTKEDKKICKKT